MKFSDLTLHQEVLKGIESAGFTDCMPVQERVLPVALQGKDVMVQSKTGSGKTAVFLVTILEKYVQALERQKAEMAAESATDTTADSENASESSKKTSQKKPVAKSLPTALIVSPTRELSVQIEEDALKLSSGIPGFKVGCFYGGVGYGKQDKMIEEGCDIYVGTPGRLLDYHKMHKIDYRMFDTFVIDEADRLFDMGFYPDVQKMFSYMRPCKERQTMLFSATLGTRVRNLAWSYMNEPEEIEVQPEEITVKAIDQELYHVSKDQKFHLFLQLMNREQPENALIFTNTKAKAVEICKRLNLNGFKTEYLMGDMPQSKRLKTIDRMKDGDIKFLVATDVAARGLQIDGLQLVVNYDIPEDFESYVHRIGRTARAGKSGKAITLACEEYIYGLEPIETYIQMKIPVIWPAEGELPEVEDKSAGLRFRDLVSEEEYASHGGDHGNRGGRKPAGGQRGGSRTGQGSRSGQGGRQGGRAGDGRSSGFKPGPNSGVVRGSVGGPKPAFDKDKKPQRRPQGGKSYAEIQKMDLEERMAYYKKQYGQELAAGDSVEKKGTSPDRTADKNKNTGKRSGARPAAKGAPKTDGTKRSTGKPQQSSGQKQRPQKASDAAMNRTKTQPNQTKKAPVQDAPVAPAKKPGIFARLFGLGKKK